MKYDKIAPEEMNVTGYTNDYAKTAADLANTILDSINTFFHICSNSPLARFYNLYLLANKILGLWSQAEAEAIDYIRPLILKNLKINKWDGVGFRLEVEQQGEARPDKPQQVMERLLIGDIDY